MSRFHAEESFEPVWKKENSKARKRAPRENRIHDHPSSSSDAPTNELLEALWRAGSKFTSNYNYNSHSNRYTKLTTSYLRFVSDKNFILWKLSQWPNLCEEYQKKQTTCIGFYATNAVESIFLFCLKCDGILFSTPKGAFCALLLCNLNSQTICRLMKNS